MTAVQTSAKPSPVRPAINRDTAFFWEGAQAGELRVQSCQACGLLRHPPGPSCPDCGSYERSWTVASGVGTVFSYVVHHAPALPGKTLPLTIALVDLDEGVRMIAEVTGDAASELRIGDRVAVEWNVIDAELTLPIWRKI